jgi:hypothetical protein
MVMLAPAAWALPLSLALAASAWQLWPAANPRLAAGSLALALASAWAGNAGAAFVLALSCLALGWQVKPAWNWSGAVAAPALLLGLLRLRIEFMPVLPEKMAFWAGLLALIGAATAAQGLLVSEDGEGAGKALAAGQLAWAAFGLVTGSAAAPLAWTGLLSLLWQQPLLRLPLSSALRGRAGSRVALALLLLGLGGCLGLSAFSAYFQLFVPLMGQGEGVGDMHAKLFSGAGLLAAVAMLAVLVQTAAFGYFYWLQVLPPAEAPRLRRPWLWLALGLSLAWGFQANKVGEAAWSALRAAGIPSPSPES